MTMGLGIEAFDQHAAFIVRGRIHRAAHELRAAVEHPLAGARQQGAGHGCIVHALENPKKPAFSS